MIYVINKIKLEYFSNRIRSPQRQRPLMNLKAHLKGRSLPIGGNATNSWFISFFLYGITWQISFRVVQYDKTCELQLKIS
jgi:hypothetical protein